MILRQLWPDVGAAWGGLGYRLLPAQVQVDALVVLEDGQAVARRVGNDDAPTTFAGAIACVGTSPVLSAWAVALRQQRLPN